MSSNLQKRLDKAKRQLSALPDLCAELARCVDEHGAKTDSGSRTKVTGSAAPLRLDVLHLVDAHHKPDYDDDWDPREVQDTISRHSVLVVLEQWAKGIMLPERDEAGLNTFSPRRLFAASADGWTIESPLLTIPTHAAILMRYWPWITEQMWADEFADTVLSLAGQVRGALGERPEYRPNCRYCRNRVAPVDHDGRHVSEWDQAAYGSCTGCEATYPKGPALDALAQVQPPMPLKEISAVIGVPVKTLHRWEAEGAIVPAPESEGRKRGKVFDLASVRVAAQRVYQRRVG